MCTAISYVSKDHYFGRNLDLEYHYNETVTVTPRKFPFHFRAADSLSAHNAMIGMATVVDNYPLYYEATNEHGLSMAGLNFPGNAVYLPVEQNKINIAPFEFIPWVISQFKTVSELRKYLKEINLINIPFNEDYPLSPLHWLISDKQESIVAEPTAEGLCIYNNPIGVLTNNPPFPYHLHNITNYLNLTSREPSCRISDQLDLVPYSRGMGAMGLPGDLSSSSRFVRAVFTKFNSLDDGTENDAVCQFFHILGSVSQQRGCVQVGKGFEKTVYSCCCNTSKGLYYYTTYSNPQITAVDLFKHDLDNSRLTTYALQTQLSVSWENR